jgi:predicted transcriptional regulator of viral defense system
VNEGKLEKLQRGLYGIPGMDFGEYHSYVEVSKKIPQGVFCLLSVLHFIN